MSDLFRKIQQHVSDTPEKVILSSMGDGKNVTFRELDLISGKVYRYLKDHGIGREDFVNIILPRGVEPFIAMLGVWKAGAAFVLLEPEYPEERIAFIRKDCGCKLVLDSGAWEEILQCEYLAGFADSQEHDAAFAVYTSGTTGNPKGVLHEYGNLDLIVRSLYENGENLTKNDERFALIAPLYFVVVVLCYVCFLNSGNCISIVPFSITKNPPALLKAFVDNRIDSLFCAPSIIRLLRKIPTLKKIYVGSEPANGIWSEDPKLSIINGYCMSETAFCVTMGHLDKPEEIAPVGKPLAKMKITLRDEEGKPVPPGETGELCVEDPFVRGYINRPEESAKAFVNGELHTRDLARLRPDGQYEVIGRIDDMIKISGNRMEPAEIEVAVSRVSGLQQVVAAGFGEGPDAFICLYYTDPVELDTEELRKKLENVLPYYMIPSRFIHLETLPRTATGKISRRLLPKPATEAREYTAPANDTERALCDAMAAALGMERFSAEDDFYALGGSSVTSIEVVGTCGLPGLTIGQIFRGRTPKKIAEYYLEELSLEKEAEGNEKNLSKPCPLTQSQLGVFLECERRKGEAVYNNPMLFSLPGDTDLQALKAAVEKMVLAHPGLFSAIDSDEHGMPAMQYQKAYAEQEICVPEQMTEETFTEARESLVQPFDIRKERLFRIRLIETKKAKYLFMDFHHLVFDGTSMQILAADLEKALGGEEIVPERWTAFDAAMAEQGARQDKEAWEKAKEWNLKQFGDADPTALPEGDLKGSGLQYGEQSFTLEVPYREMKAFCEKQKTTENVLATAAFGYLLAAYTLKKEVLFTTVYNGRRDPRCSRTVSMFVTTLPVLCRRGGNLSVAEYLSELKERLLGSMANDLYSFAELAADTGLTSDVQFVWQADMFTLPKGSTLKLKREELPFIATGDALSAQLFPEGDRLVFEVQYHADRYSSEYIAQLAKCMNQVLKEMMAKEKLSELSLVSAEESREIAALSKGEELKFDAGQTWLDLFRENVEKTPQKTAVSDSRGSYTYEELNRAADRIAAYLRAGGAEENSFVAVRMGRVKEFAAAVIGIHKAGAAYLPVDLDYPEERVNYMLSDSGARILLTEETVAEILSGKQEPPAGSEPEGAGKENLSPDHLAYMIYTSGSTGKPKGVMIQHKALLNFVQFIRSRWGLSEKSRIALHSNFSFDAAVEDLFPPLTAGGTVCIVPESARRDPEKMREFLKENRINGGSYSTQFGQLLAADEPLDVDYLCVGGEAMTVVPRARGPVYNAYGPTEFTVDATYYELDKTRTYRTIPIGRPVHNCCAYIMDPFGGLLPKGFTGELCLAGPQMALGYWNQPELTKEKFTTTTIGEEPVRIYHTGDLARYNEEGQLEYLGRIDTQVKLRGFRIELGEIESRAAGYEGIALAAAEVKKDQLILYYACKKDAPVQEVDESALKDFLAKDLADYMIPSIFMQLEDMPLTPNGKIDRKALPEPEVRRTGEYAAPEGEAECSVAEAMKQVLGMEQAPGATDSFFDLGGDSIRAIRLVSLLREMGLQVSVADIMKQKTVRGIAGCTESAGTAAISQEPYEGAVPDSAIVAFFKDIKLPCPNHYNQTRLLELSSRAGKDNLRKAWDALAYQHDMLRAVLREESLFVRGAGTTTEVEEYTVPAGKGGENSGENREAVTEICKQVQTGIHPEKGLVRLALIHGTAHDYLYIAIHHLVIDGVSWRIILSDLETAYGQALKGEEIRLPSKTNTYNDYANAIRRYRDSYILSLEIPYWQDVQKKLAGLKTADAKDYKRNFGQLTVTLDPENTRGFLRADFGKLNAEINDALLAAVCRSYHDVTGNNGISVQLEGHGREETGDGLSTDRTVGWFTSEYPVIVEGLNQDLRHDFLAAKEALHRAPNKGFGYNVLRFIQSAKTSPNPAEGIDPELTAQVGFNYLGDMGAEENDGVRFFADTDIPAGPDISPQNCYGPDIAINCFVQGGCFRLMMDFNRDLYAEKQAQEFADGILLQMGEITKYLSSDIPAAVTATDLGEKEWSEEEFETVTADFASRGETLERIYPLLPMQEGMLLKAVSEPESHAYRMADVFELDGNPTEEMLRRALDRLGRKHEVLRTAIIHEGVTIPRQAIVDRKLGLQMIDLSTDADAKGTDAEEAVMRIREDILTNGFDLQRKPLFSVTCVKLQEGRCYLIAAVHHIIVDGWCTGLYMGSFVEYLKEELKDGGTAGTGRPAETAPDTGRYEAAVREILKKDMAAGLEYWKELLDGYETRAAIPSWGKVPEEMRSKEEDIFVAIDPEVTAGFEQACRKAGATINTGVELAWGMVLGTCSRQNDVVFARVVSGRDNTRVRTDDLVGLFINSVPVRIRIEKNTTAAEALKALQEQAAKSNGYDFCALSEIQKQSSLGTDLLQTVFAFENYSSGGNETVAEDLLKPVWIREENFSEISPYAYVENGKLVLHVKFDTGLYREAEIRRVLALFKNYVKEITEKPEGEIHAYGHLDRNEQENIVSLSRGTSLPYDAGKTWLDHFILNARRNPEKTAVTGSTGSYTYAELDKASDAVAACLIERGVEENSFVAVKMSHVKEFVPAVIGIQKAGAAYVPVDPEYPEDRIRYMLEDSEAKVVLTQETVREILAEYRDAEAVNRATPGHRAYMIYTSGSTGKPKGVIQSHRSLCAFATWRQKKISIGPDSIHALHPSFSFDASLDDLICPLFAGGEVHIFSDELCKDMQGMAEYIREHRINSMTMSTQIGMAMVNQYPDLKLRYIMMGGEKMLPCEKTEIRIYNGYGPTEFTVCSSFHVVDQERDTDIPIGRPVPNTWSFICDEAGNLMPQGMAGELCLAGPQIAEGYWKRKDLTDEKFISCPFAGGTEMKMYRTGDLARYNEDKELEFLGRIDAQVKLRGFRIELGEIENAASLYEGIAQVAARVCDDHLVLYYTGNRQIDPDALRDFLAGSLTEYMIPAAYKQLDEMPMTPNGKIDRKELQKIPVVSDEQMVPPANETEQKISDLVKSVLSGRETGVTAELRREGLTSLSAMRLSALISKEFGKNFRMTDLNEYGTIRKIAEYLGTDIQEEHFERQDSYPITAVQQGIYVECMANYNTSIYNTPVLLKLDRGIDIARLKQAVAETTDAHPYLKMRLALGEDGQIAAWRRDEDRQQVTEVEFATLENGFEGLVKPFNLVDDCLFRTMIVHDGEDNYLFLDGHHIVTDGESMQIFMRDLNLAYAGETPAKESFTGFEAALAEAKLRNGPQYDQAKEYYRGLLEGFDTDCLPVYDRDLGRTEIGTLTMAAPVNTDRLASAVKDGSVTLNGLWNAAFGLALTAFLYRDDCVYTTVYNGRNDPRLGDSIGMFVHTLPVVCNAGKNESGLAFARRMGQQLADSMSNDIYSFAEISKAFDVKANIIFIYQGGIGSEPEIGGKKAESILLHLNALKAPLTINVLQKDGGFEIFSEYDAQHYEEWSIRALIDLTVRIFDQLTEDRPIGSLSLISPEEKRALDAVNQTEKAVESTDIVALFRKTAKQYPERRAVVCLEKTLSYRELDERTDRIAAYLQERGIGAGDVVGILIPRSEYMVITALSVLKTGAAYQPLDPAYPTERLKIMVEDSGAKALIEDEKLKDRLPDYKGEILYIHETEALPDKKPAMLTPGPDALFILLYTSGTTGVPKGVMLTHGNLVNFCQWYRDYFGLTEEATVSAYASFGFDACMMDLYPALTTGASVCIVPEEMKLNLPEMNTYFEKNSVTHAFLTTQMMRMFATTMTGTKVKYLVGGGEKLVPFNPEGDCRFYNGYGPTECTILATINQVEEYTFRVSTGGPLDNYKCYVAGKDGSELPVGALGELWIAGYGVAKGYLNKPELTEKVFIRNPFCDVPGYDRAYRTGDIVRWLPNGTIDFIGRNDGQVKIRGFRIELTEVEGIIRMFEGIRDVTVQAFDSPSGGKYIAAYYVADREIDKAELTEFIKSKKPAYMVPAAFMQIDSIPLNQNQKVNKRMLPVPEIRQEGKVYAAPATPLEKELCEEFAKVLNTDRVGVTDNFFEIGGSSIAAASLLTYAMGKGYHIVYKDIFDNPTPRKLAAVILGAGLQKKTDEVSGYDYSKINRFIGANSMASIDDISGEPIGDVILAGATGFLGIHVLQQFLEKTDGKITCLMRKVQWDTLENHLKSLLMYYFEKPYEELFGKRIFCLEGDITDKESLLAIDKVKAKAIINCAANVKHFVADDEQDRINFHGVENLIEVCLKNHMRLVQISTLSVGGSVIAGMKDTLYENDLYIGQQVDNNYIRTKFLAERAVLEARAGRGLDAVVLRAGNLMGRYSDGEFQINLLTNAFMRSLAAFNRLGACPVTALTDPIEFSPIDATAAAVLILAGVNSKFSVFNVNNNHTVTRGDIIFAMNRHGFRIDIVTEKEFARIMQEASENDANSEALMSLTAYESKEDNIVPVTSDNYFTTNALYRLGFKWPIVDDAYLEKLISAVESLEFFKNL